MPRPNPIRSIMTEDLAPIWVQKRKPFRPTDEFVKYSYNTINKHVFSNKLTRPEIKLGVLRNAWGWCLGYTEREPSGSFCTIKLVDKWYSSSWFMNTLAHEMAHQYQYDIMGPHRESMGQLALMSHGPSFFMWRDQFEHYGLHLKTYHRIDKWFDHQSFKKC